MTLHPSPSEEFLEDGRAGVLHIGNSNHSLLYTVRKLKLSKFRPNVNKVRDFKHFSDSQFRSDLSQVHWDAIGKSIFHEILNSMHLFN